MMQRIDYTVLDAKECDSVQISELEKECFSSPWTKKQIEDEIIKDNVIFLSAKIGNIVLGYISGQLILDEFYISNIAVKSEYRGMGIASSLISELISRLSEKNVYFATLEVRQSNLVARKLYEKFGFNNLGIRKNFYSAPTENACIYTKYFRNE